jgi:hypothetical protein
MNDPPGRTALEDVYDNIEYENDMHHHYHDNDKNDTEHQDDMTFDWSSISSIGDDHSNDDDDYDNYEDDDMVPDRTTASTTTTDDVIVDAPSSTSFVPMQQNTHHQHQQCPKKHVTFGMVETYEVQSIKDFETDDYSDPTTNTSFWYTSYEMLSTRKAGRILSITDPNVRNYLYYYEYLYRKLISNDDLDHHEGKADTMGTTDADTTSNLTALDTKILAYGLYDGYQGLERESSFEVYRQKERREVVRMILEVHQSMKSTQLDNNDDERLRSFALSLTTKMSYWAYCIGQAGHLASNNDALYQTTNVIP